MERPALSIVIPIFNEQAVIPELGRRLAEFLERLRLPSWEAIFVDDGSRDASLALLSKLCAGEPRFRVVSLSRNFGQQAAMSAGLDYARGEAVVLMDADLQDPPEVVGEMLERFREGYDVIYGVRRARQGDGPWKRLSAALFYRVLRLVSSVQIPVDAGDFRLMSRRVVVALRAFGERGRLLRGLIAWLGYKQTAVSYVRAVRFAGETHYTLRRMVQLASDAMFSFSVAPLRLVSWAGAAAALVAAGLGAWFLLAPAGRGPSPVLAVVALASSAQLLATGVVAAYVGRVHDEVRRRPLYLVDAEINATREHDRTP